VTIPKIARCISFAFFSDIFVQRCKFFLETPWQKQGQDRGCLRTIDCKDIGQSAGEYSSEQAQNNLDTFGFDITTLTAPELLNTFETSNTSLKRQLNLSISRLKLGF